MTVKCPVGETQEDVKYSALDSRTSKVIETQEHHLILDLDHTLISSFEFGESPTQRPAGTSVVSPILADDYFDELGLPQMYHATISNVVVLIKLRPFVRTFIKAAAATGLTLHVYTKGRRTYMNEVIRLIDPDGFIKGKLISRDDEPSDFKETKKDPLLIDESFAQSHVGVIILDDSPAVWSHCAHFAEIIAARRYAFSDRFVAFLRSMERSIVKAGSYPRDTDDYLSDLLDTVVSEAMRRLEQLRKVVPPLSFPEPASPLVVSTASSDFGEEDTFTPINEWAVEEMKPQHVCGPRISGMKTARAFITLKREELN
jgi:hypothetical protein